jgi:hypothetical protein
MDYPLARPMSICLWVIKLDGRVARSKEPAMRGEKMTADRLSTFSDAVFAVIVTVMALELRSLIVLAGFTTAMLVALVAPRLGFGLICGALILHLRPDVSGSRS